MLRFLHTNRSLVSVLLVFFFAGFSSAQELTPALLKSFQWRPLGPSATGGRIVDLAVHPKNPHIIYAAAASGGLWKTVNNGTTWKCVFQHQGTLSIGDVALDPSQPDTIWVGTGEANNQRSSLWGDGIYKSTDGGKTWKNVGLPDTHHIGRIVVHPTNSDTVYVAALGHLYTFNKERGLFKTTDGGTTWEKVLYVNERVGVVDVVIDPKDPSVLYAATYERLRRAWDFDGAGPGSAIYKSSDSGKTWIKLKGGLPTGEIGRIGLAIYPKNPKVVYATVSNQNPKTSVKSQKEVTLDNFGMKVEFEKDKCLITSIKSGGLAQRYRIRKGEQLFEIADRKVSTSADLTSLLSGLREGDVVIFSVGNEKKRRPVAVSVPDPRGPQVGGEIYRTDDAGVTWIKQNKKPVGGTPAYYYGQIRVDPNDHKRLYLCSVPLYVSDDAGKTWSSKGASSVHVDHHAVWINPKNSNHVLLGNDGGFHISYDRAQTWDHVYNLPLTQFYAIGTDMRKPYYVYGGTQDNGTYGGPSRSRNPSGTGRFEWDKVGGGDGFYVQVDPNDHNIIFLESQFGVLRRVHLSSGQSKFIRPKQSDPTGPRDRYNWNSPILMSHFDPRVIYFGGNKVFKSYNRGDNWTVISPDLTTADPSKLAGNVPHCTITTIAESPKNRDMLLVGTDDGNVQWTNDGGKTWTNMRDRFPLRPATWWCSRVELSHHDTNVAYVSFTGYREDDFRPFVFMTEDQGKTWKSIIGNLDQLSPSVGSINVIKEDPRNPNLLYVGSEFGVFVSLNRGKNWLPLNNELPRVSVQDLLIHSRDRDLVIGTHGRGAFVVNVSPLQEMADKVIKSKVHLFSIPNAVLWQRVARKGISGNRKFYAPNPPSGARITIYLKDKIEEKGSSLKVLDSKDKTVTVLKVPTTAGLHQVRWSLTRGTKTRSRFGTRVGPGRYTVVLKIGESELRQPLVVEADPILANAPDVFRLEP
ncbi:MAG: WD40/YVTN/BNR-like repeat-containing protein [Gemmataceae bacterium]